MPIFIYDFLMVFKLAFLNFGISLRISSHVVALYFSSNVLMFKK